MAYYITMKHIASFILGILVTAGLVFGGVYVYRQMGTTEKKAVISNELRVTYLDVGQGDAVLIQTPKGKNFMIDAGPEGALAKPLSKVLPKHSVIDGFFITNPHADHISGMGHVLEKYKVQNVYYTGVTHTTPTFTKNFEKLKESGVAVTKVSKEQSFTTDDGVLFEILYPNSDMTKETNWEWGNDGINDTSIVVQVTYGTKKFLFMGDASKVVELRLIGLGFVGKTDVLKVGHHGSETSTAEEFIETIKPAYAILSLGEKNDYGHPHKSVLKTLAKYGVTVLRTDKQGSITINTDGNTLRVVPEFELRTSGN